VVRVEAPSDAETERGGEVMTLEEAIEDAERTLNLWHRVCGELEDGKDWQEIDDGMSGGKWSLDRWSAYMRQKMYHNLNVIVLTYRAAERRDKGKK